jgi:uncharacterized phiE125 gp8 family phage protein
MLPNFTVRTGPTAEPISLAEAKLHCRAEDTEAEDSEIRILIAAARRYAENATNRVLVTQSLRATLPCLPKQINLRAPLRKVTSISYLDTANAPQTLAPADYVVDSSEMPGIVVPAYGSCWPSTYIHPQSVKADFIAGYVTPFAVNPTTDVITAAGHPYANGDTVPLSNSGGVLPAGLDTNVDYYAVNVSGNTLQLSLTEGGAAVDMTSSGMGTHFLGVVEEEIRLAMLLMIAHWGANREASVGYSLNEIPMGVDILLEHHKVYGF